MSDYILVTGAAGFIGFHLCKKLLNEGFNVVGLDNLNSYYDIDLKKSRLKLLDLYHKKNNCPLCSRIPYQTPLLSKNPLSNTETFASDR